MIVSSSYLSLKQISFLFITYLKFSKSVLFSLLILNLFILSCSPTKRFTEKEEKPNKLETNEGETNVGEEKINAELNFSEIRVSLQGLMPTEQLYLESDVNLFNEKSNLGTIDERNSVNFYGNDGYVYMTTSGRNVESKEFYLEPKSNEGIIKVNGKRYRGKIKISASNSSINIINILNLEDYVKGVLSKEMPIGRNEENLEALKALAICIRTYAINKIEDGKFYFDIYADTRDQVYGGVDAETQISNKAVDETKNLILKYEDTPATIFYHSTCGGFTESSQNVFTTTQFPYLESVKDGNDPNCKISPRFSWQEKYSKELIVDRLKNYSLLDNQDYTLDDVSVISRFSSGRVNELELDLEDENGEDKSFIIKGNEIRSIIRTTDGKNILWSTMFEVSINSNYVILSGKGFGHGVGLCQWGAIALSQKRWSYTGILEHYFQGTTVEKIND